MSYQIHPQARTTPKVREEIKNSSLSAAQLAKKYNITLPTSQKWKLRESVEDRSHRPHKINTTLSEEQELIVVALQLATG
jgi:endoglucanase Acf2